MDSSNISGSSDPLINPTPSNRSEANGMPGSTQTAAGAGVKEASFQIFSDALENGQTIIQQFIPSNLRGAKTEYQAAPDNPMLVPPDPDGGTAPTPFESSWQRAVNKFFREQLREALVKEKVQEKGTSASPQEISGEELADIETGVNRLMLATGKNQRKSLSKEEQAIAAEATTKTQKAWALPASWSLGTTTAANWTPVRSDVVPPVNIETSRKEEVGANIQQLGQDIETVGKDIIADLSPDDPKRIAVTELILVITQALRDLKEVLQVLQIQDAKMSEQVFAAKYDEIDQKMAHLEKQIKQQEKMLHKQEKAADKQKKMKVITLVVSISIAVVGAVLVPLTFGASTPLIFASVAIAAALISYSVADYKEGYTQEMMASFDSWLVKTFPDSKTREAMKAVILTVALLTLLVASLSAGASVGTSAGTTVGGAAASTAATTATTTSATTAATTGANASMNVATQTACEIAKQATIEFTIMFIMASNIAPDLAVSALTSSGAIDKDDEKAKMIAQIVVMVATMLLTMGLVANASQTSRTGAMTLGTFAKQIGSTVTHTLKDAGKILDCIAEGTKKALTEALQLIKQMIQTLSGFLKRGADLVQEAGEVVKNAFNAAAKAMNELVEALKSMADSIKAGTALEDSTKNLQALLEKFTTSLESLSQALKNQMKQSMTNVKDYFDEIIKDLPKAIQEKAYKYVTNLADILKVGGHSVEAVGNIQLGMMGLGLVKLLREIGDNEKALEVTLQLIRVFEQLLESFQQSSTEGARWINDLNHAIDSAFGTASQSLTKATQQAIA